MPQTIKKGNVSVTLSINKELYNTYKKFSEKEGLLISRQVGKIHENPDEKRQR